MGTNVSALERHYSKLIATMAAQQLAKKSSKCLEHVQNIPKLQSIEVQC